MHLILNLPDLAFKQKGENVSVVFQSQVCNVHWKAFIEEHGLNPLDKCILSGQLLFIYTCGLNVPCLITKSLWNLKRYIQLSLVSACVPPVHPPREYSITTLHTHYCRQLYRGGYTAPIEAVHVDWECAGRGKALVGQWWHIPFSEGEIMKEILSLCHFLLPSLLRGQCNYMLALGQGLWQSHNLSQNDTAIS